MKVPHLPLLTCAALLSGCANTVFIGHKHGVDLETELKADLTAPVSLNFGYESNSVVAVPPKKALPFRAALDPKNVHDGELLSTYSRFSVQRDVESKTGSDGNIESRTLEGAFTIRTGVASGLAARAISKQQESPSGGAALRIEEAIPFTAKEAASAFSSMNAILNK